MQNPLQKTEVTTAQEINELHAQINMLGRDALQKALRIGELLIEQRQRCKHGEWLPWLKANVQFTQKTANNYMRVYEARSKLESVSNLAEAYRLTLPRAKPPDKPSKTSTRGRITPKLDEARQIIRSDIEAEKPVNPHKLEKEHGISHVTFDMAITAELARKQTLREPQVTRADLSATAQQKFDRAIGQEKERLGAQLQAEVNERINRLLADTIGPRLRKEQKEARWIMESRKGVMTRKQFNQIRACLHTDHVATAEEKNLAFALFSDFEKYLLKESESPTPFVQIPTTSAEWDALKKQAMEARRQKAKNKTTSISKRG